ncbi:MAG: M15 family metallopeptidase [Gammaproteobacteria bacterium]
MQEVVRLEKLGISLPSIEARGLSMCEEAEEVVIAEVGDDGRQHQLTPEASSAWKRMKSAARDEGVELFIVSAYRSIARQVEIIQAKLDKGERIEDILRVSAPPGFSEHHTGRAADVSTPQSVALDIAFEQTPAFSWLQRHAGKFCFRLSYPPDNAQGYQYEPWHWCYVAVQ